MPLEDSLAARLTLLEDFTPADIAAQTPELVAAVTAFAAPIGRYRTPDADVAEMRAPGPHGPVPVRVYRPRRSPASGAGLVWVHGGGFRAGDLDLAEADAVSRELTARAGATVISVGYRLAVDGVRFPVPHDDVVAAWRWAAAHAGALGVANGRLALGGGSAGAHLAAGAALAVRDAGDTAPEQLVLVYPTLHRELPPPAAPLPSDMDRVPPALRFPPETMQAMYDNYLGAGDPGSPYGVPGDADPSGLPPVLIVASEYDDLRASADAFAAAVRAAGGVVGAHVEPGVPHGHLNVPGSAGFDGTLRHIARALSPETAR